MAYADVEWVSGETDTAAKFAQMIENARHVRNGASVEPRLVACDPFVSRGLSKLIGATHAYGRLRLFINGGQVYEGSLFGASATWGLFAVFNASLGAVPTFRTATVTVVGYAMPSGGGAEQELGTLVQAKIYPTSDHGLLSLAMEHRLIQDKTEFDSPASGAVNIRLRGLAIFTHRLPLYAAAA